MIKCLAIDDEPLALQQLVAYIKKIPYLELTAACQSAAEAQNVLAKEQVDAMFIDINMPDLSGMDFVCSLHQTSAGGQPTDKPLVVFTTAYSDYAVKGFEVNAIDYLLKPFGMEEMQRAAAKLKERIDLEEAAQQSAVGCDDDAIFLKTDYKIMRLEIKDIRYVEGMSEYLRIHVDNQPKPLIVLMSMKKMEERLPANFMRVHRSYIVNLKKIKEVNKNRVILDADTYIPIGDLYKEAFNAYINSKFLGK